MRRQAGFTLVEMLAVLAILVLLAGMIYVVAGAAKARAARVACLASLRSLGSTMLLYQDEMRIWPGAGDVRHWQEVDWLDPCRTYPESYAENWNEEIAGMRWLPGEAPPPPAGGFPAEPVEVVQRAEILATWCWHGHDRWLANLWLDGRVTTAREEAAP